MGWASGTSIATEMIDIIQQEVSDSGVKRKLYVGLINALENHDWDTEDEAMGLDPVFDEAMFEINPDMREWFEGEDDETAYD